jgi:hypothetical protein
LAALALEPTANDGAIVELYRPTILANDHEDVDLSLRRGVGSAYALTAQRFDVDVAIGAETSANGTRGQVLVEQKALDVFLADVAGKSVFHRGHRRTTQPY